MSTKQELLEEAKKNNLPQEKIQEIENMSEKEINQTISREEIIKDFEEKFPLDLSKFDYLSTRERREIRKMTLKGIPLEGNRSGAFKIGDGADLLGNQDDIMIRMLKIGRGLDVDEEIKKGKAIPQFVIKELYNPIESADPLGLESQKMF
jgi:hypothetical protein